MSARKPKSLNRVATIGYGRLCLSEKSVRLNKKI